MPGPFPLSRIAPIVLALTLFGAGGIGVARGDDAAPVLIVTGRVTDAQGQPIAKARVLTGDSRLSATVDASGRYTLTLPLARADALARYPYKLSLRAEAKGWAIVLPGGDSGLGLELRTVTALDGTNRCFARSNDVRVAAAAARAVGSAKEPAAVTVNFVGEKGEKERGADPELTQTAQVALSALALPPLRDSISIRVTEPPVVAAPPARPPVAASPPATTPAPQPPTVTPSSPSAANDRSARREEQKRLDRETREREREAKEKRAREEALARITSEAAKESAKGTSIERHDRERAEEQARREAKAQARITKRQDEERVESERVAKRSAERAAKDAREAARDASRDSLRTAANVARDAKARADAARVAAARLAKTTAVKPVPAAKDQVVAGRADETPVVVEKPPAVEAARPPVEVQRPPVASPPPPVANPVPVASPSPAVATPSPAVLPATPPASQATAPRRAVIIHPPPEGEGRLRSAPFVIRSGGRPAPETVGASDSCSCRIAGTVEVRSNEPLTSPVRVVVSLAWYPAAADTVELFMGSPRAFHLPAVACGPQRLKITLPGRERFDVLTRDAVAGFRCDGGPVHQVRIVLGPR